MSRTIEENVQRVRERIRAAALRAGRDPGFVTLLAASKNRSAAEVSEAVRAGIRVIGENRVQEMLRKIVEVGDGVEWDFIGHLQRNKVRSVVGSARLIHSVDSIELAREIDRRAVRTGTVQPVLLQVNVAGEESKHGVCPDKAGDILKEAAELGGVAFRGLSTLAPHDPDPERVRWVFRELRNLAGDLFSRGMLNAAELSMGMTNDFEVAVEEGATIVRIGSAIFDRR